jgi:hypothetical protein
MESSEENSKSSIKIICKITTLELCETGKSNRNWSQGATRSYTDPKAIVIGRIKRQSLIRGNITFFFDLCHQLAEVFVYFAT